MSAPIIDMDAFRECANEAGFPKGTQFAVRVPGTGANFESGRPHDLTALLKPHYPPSGESTTVHLDFADDPLLIPVDGLPRPVRCLGFDAEVTMKTHIEQSDIRLDEYVKFHFLDVLSGEGQFIASDGGPPTAR